MSGKYSCFTPTASSQNHDHGRALREAQPPPPLRHLSSRRLNPQIRFDIHV